MKVALVWVRGSRTAWSDVAAADYGKRIGRYFPFEEVVVRATSQEEEGRRLLKEVPVRGRLVAFDERGSSLDSVAFSGLLTHAADAGVTRLVFAIGGAYGFGPEVRAAASLVSLAPFVLNHAVARVVAMEQIYRACTIRAGEPYHHA